MDLTIIPMSLVTKFSFNFLVAAVIIKLIYHRDYRGNDFVFTYFMFNTLIFFFAYILGNLNINMAFGFSLFAVFAILRYRTDPIPIKEMTYLFIVITIGVINALSNEEVSVFDQLFANGVIVLLTYFLENFWMHEKENHLFNSKLIVYDNLDLIKPDKEKDLIKDLKDKTGLNIVQLRLGRINYKEARANVRIYFQD